MLAVQSSLNSEYAALTSSAALMSVIAPIKQTSGVFAVILMLLTEATPSDECWKREKMKGKSKSSLHRKFMNEKAFANIKLFMYSIQCEGWNSKINIHFKERVQSTRREQKFSKRLWLQLLAVLPLPALIPGVLAERNARVTCCAARNRRARQERGWRGCLRADNKF
ncbi:unnamed protein product [Ceratitis capitata]|uniref:(Mediterranean fruit fly) hypothetical protein n=1 Tax=Ceratitis capitata TaxID=7213 RepID=A0A811V0L3_CERCA|nr:unnamed protein product [Ceratitis capitata]